MVSVDHMLISILSMLVEALEMSCAETLAPCAWNLKPDDLLSYLHLMCDFRKPNLSFIKFCCCIISFGACPDNASWSFTRSTIASSESVRYMLVMHPFLYRECHECDVLASPQPRFLYPFCLSLHTFLPLPKLVSV